MSIVSSIRSSNPGVQRLVLVNLLLQAGNHAAYYVGLIGTAAYLFGADAYEISLLVAVIYAFHVLGSALVGVVIDRMGPKKVLVALLAAYTLATGSAAFVELTYPVLLVGAGILALLVGAASTTISSFPPYIVQEPTQLKDANSLVDTALHLSIIVGPAIGGAIAGAVSPTAVFVFAAAVTGVATVVGLKLDDRYAPERKQKKSRSAIRDFADGLHITFANPNLRLLLAVGFLGFFAYGAFDSLESLFYRDVLRVGVEWMGYLSMLSGIGAVVGSMILLRIPHERVNLRLLASTLLLTGVGSMTYVGTSLLPIAAIGQALTGLGFGLMTPVQHLLVQESCELEYMGRVTSVMRIGLNVSGVLPLVISPILAGVFGVQGVLFGASCFVAFVAVCFVLVVKRRA